MKNAISATLAAVVALSSTAASAGFDPTWPGRVIATGWQPPAGHVRAAPFIGLSPERVRLPCNSDFFLAQVISNAPYEVTTVEGLPSSQYKIETAYYGLVVPTNGGTWRNVMNLGVQIRGAARPGTQRFRIVTARPGGLNFDLGRPTKIYGVQDFYVETACD